MFIEDLIQKLCHSSINLNLFDKKFVLSLYNQLNSGIFFTEKQAKLALTVLKKYKIKLSIELNQDILLFLENPQYRHAFRQINLYKTIEIVNYKNSKRVIKVSFPYDENLISKFKKEKLNFHHAFWDPDEKSWIFELHEKNLLFLSTLVNEFNFIGDDEFINYIDQINKITSNVENYIPMVVKDGDLYVLKNVHPIIQGTLGNTLISSLFEARKKGIFTWSDDIETEIENSNEYIVVKRFLKSHNNKEFTINLEETPLQHISSIVKNLFPCFVIIPGGSELDVLKKNYEFFESIGINRSNMSVLFRLSNKTDKEFNDYVRNQQLNNPLDDNSKVIYISNNIPKTYLESRININSVLNYSLYTPHYKLRDFIVNQHNVINILEIAQQRRLNFGIV